MDESLNNKLFMKTNKTQDISILKRYYGVIKNGLFLFGLRNRLAKIGLDFRPYYWVEEECEPCDTPQIKGNTSNYKLRYISLEEAKLINQRKSKNDYNNMVRGMQNGQLCVGLETNNEIVAYMFIELNDFEFNKRAFKLKSNEAYLLNMWTMFNFRGRNLAPFLRYKAYRLLEEEHGRNIKYSITEYFNKSSIKFKNKLNSKNHFLYLSIVLFKKYTWNFTLKKY